MTAAELLARDPWWLVAGKALVIFVLLLLITLFCVVYERKVVAYMQMRVGPTRVGPWGTLQSLADGLKLALKEDITPRAADRVVFVLAPVIAGTCAFLSMAVIPFGPEVTVFGHTTVLQLTDLPVGVLFVLAATSIGVYGIVLAGWSSGSVYPLLGGLRSTAQVLSYEIAMALSFVAVFLIAGSMSTSDIVLAQDGLWYGVLLAPSLLIYLVAMVGETNRAPFDLPEAEGELVGGFHTEYSSLKFATFMLAEYINMVTVSALASTLFLGAGGTVADLVVGRGQSRRLASIVVAGQGVAAAVRVHLVARNTSPVALRPVHDTGLEAADPVLARLDRGGGRRADPWRSSGWHHPVADRRCRGGAAARRRVAGIAPRPRPGTPGHR